MRDVVLICGTIPQTVPSILVLDSITNPPAGRHRRRHATSITVVDSTSSCSRSPTALSLTMWRCMASNRLAPGDNEARTRQRCPEVQTDTPGHQHGLRAAGRPFAAIAWLARVPRQKSRDPGSPIRPIWGMAWNAPKPTPRHDAFSRACGHQHDKGQNVERVAVDPSLQC
jgi:hypothetical protein